VTGSNSGIGRSIVHRFVKEGAKIAFVGRDHDKGAKVAAEVKELGGDAQFFALDLAKADAVQDLFAKLGKRFGRLDIVMNNAGLGSRLATKQASSPAKRSSSTAASPSPIIHPSRC
jgi:NAD(P)-dependent dehydrogenase (short-subunit alcohol dehydrogenase family)